LVHEHWKLQHGSLNPEVLKNRIAMIAANGIATVQNCFFDLYVLSATPSWRVTEANISPQWHSYDSDWGDESATLLKVHFFKTWKSAVKILSKAVG
jgi:hypothetical protein